MTILANFFLENICGLLGELSWWEWVLSSWVPLALFFFFLELSCKVVKSVLLVLSPNWGVNSLLICSVLYNFEDGY